MDPNTQKNLMGAAGAGEAAAGAGQEMIHGYYNVTQKTATKRFIVPPGVTSICGCCIGAGEIGEVHTSDADGGKGGDLKYVNDISVSPGDVLLLGAGTGFSSDANGMDSNHSSTGYYSYIRRKTGGQGSTENWENLVFARGGNNAGTNIGTGTNGSYGADGSASNAGGGGGSGGYTTSDDGQSGDSAAEKQGKMGGGVGVTGNNETPHSQNSEYQGTGGAHGADWRYLGSAQGCYGGGGGGFNSDNGQAMSTVRSHGAVGAARIIWGEGRSYPSNAQGYFPTPPAGTELELRYRFPVNYLNTIIAMQTPYGIKNIGLEIIDDTGANLVEATAHGSSYDGLPINSAVGSIDWDGVTDATPNGTIYDFDDISASSGIVLNNIGGSSFGISPNILKLILNKNYKTGGQTFCPYGDQDMSTYVNLMPSDADNFDSELAGSTLTAPHEDHFYTNSILIKFDSAKVIKKINFYVENTRGWVPPMKILLDGNVIANDAAHFIDPPSGSNYPSTRMATFEFT
tara:strand:- start:1104 stop:2645 length:1542 start_codon:yes stop_codon:yes gene_type:complete